MYDVKYNFDDGLFWIIRDGEVLRELGGFIEPITPKIIVKEIQENGEI